MVNALGCLHCNVHEQNVHCCRRVKTLPYGAYMVPKPLTFFFDATTSTCPRNMSRDLIVLYGSDIGLSVVLSLIQPI
jgi:hypothetical protein